MIKSVGVVAQHGDSMTLGELLMMDMPTWLHEVKAGEHEPRNTSRSAGGGAWCRLGGACRCVVECVGWARGQRDPKGKSHRGPTLEKVYMLRL